MPTSTLPEDAKLEGFSVTYTTPNLRPQVAHFETFEQLQAWLCTERKGPRRKAGYRVADRWYFAGTRKKTKLGLAKAKGRYVAEVIASDGGKPTTKTFDDKPEAEGWAAAEFTRLSGLAITEGGERVYTFGSWMDYWWANIYPKKGKAAETLKGKRRAIRKLRELAPFIDKPMTIMVAGSHYQNITGVDVAMWHNVLAETPTRDNPDGHPASYIQSLDATLKQIFSAAVSHLRKQGFTTNPMLEDSQVTGKPKVKSTPVRVPLIADVQATYDAMPDHYKAAIVLGTFAGLRINETCGLQRQDIDTENNCIWVRRQHGKEGTKTRTPQDIERDPTQERVFVDPIAMDALVRHMGMYVGPEPTASIVGAADETIHWHLRRVRPVSHDDDSAARPTITPHRLRDFFASMLIHEGSDLATVKAQLRHGRASTTYNRYIGTWPKANTARGRVVERFEFGLLGPDVVAVLPLAARAA